MPETNVSIGYGTQFQIQEEGSPDNYTTLAEVTSITLPSAVVDQIDATHMQSPNRTREFIAGLIDPGECTFDMNFVPGSTADDRLHELLALPVTDNRRSCRVEFVNGVTWTFDAVLTNYEPTAPVDDKMTASVTFKVTGSLVRGTSP